MLRQLFDAETFTYTYLLADENTRQAILIDPVRDQVERDTKLLAELGLTLAYTLETHVHADHVTASGALRERLGSKSVLSHRAGTGCADVLVRDGDHLSFGGRTLEVLETPGHTDGCLSYYDRTSGAVFTGDALLIRGCGRTDFQQGDPKKLYQSITSKLFTLPNTTTVYPGHDYQGRTASTIGEEKAHNPRLAGASEARFVETMQALRLDAPKHLAEAVPANLRCGRATPMAAEPIPEKSWAPVERVSGVPELTTAWLDKHRAEVRLIDVREPEELEGELGCIPNSESFPMGGLERQAMAWNRAAPLVVICRSGRRSATAAQSLERLGFTRVASLRGGMLDWNTERRPTVRRSERKPVRADAP